MKLFDKVGTTDGKTTIDTGRYSHWCDPACTHIDGAPPRRQFLRASLGLAAAGGLSGLGLAGCASTAPAGPADTVVLNARIATMDPKAPRAQAMAVSGTQFCAVGSDLEMQRWIGPRTRVIDAQGRTVVPGLIDSHAHFIRGGLTYSQELRWDGVASLADAMTMLRDQARRTQPPHWVQVVGGFSPYQFREKRLPTLAEINAATGEVPCFILNLYDRAFLNRAALRVLGFDRDTPNPFGSVLEKDAAGQPTGLVVNTTSLGGLVALFARVPKLSDDDQALSTQLYMREMNRLGLTSVVDAGGGGQNYPDHYAGIAKLAAERKMTLRISYNLFAQRPGQELADYQAWSQKVSPGQGDDFLRMAGAGEYILWAATDPANFGKSVAPAPIIMESKLAEVATFLVAKGWPIRMHASYDSTASRILDVLEQVNREVPMKRVRWALDHCETLSPRSMERVAAMGGRIAIQNRMSLDGEVFAQTWGRDAAADAPAIGRMRSMGLPVACGTDSSRATSYNPWVSLHWLVTGKTLGDTRLNADRNLVSREEALRMWTVEGAALTGDEARKGSIATGRLADFALLSDDYFAVAEDDIKDITAVFTMVGGEVVHASGPFAAQSPTLVKPMPDWLPVNVYGGYQQRRRSAVAQAPGVHGGGCCGSATTAPVIIGDQGNWRFSCGCAAI
ncbi:amidohydrolase [Variovorax sp. LT1R16]|uniref:amidohydrolase n=1 Tax=Variovorax sp. LT1R16 TaxID=3443728 RepID=UPI003F47DFBC